MCDSEYRYTYAWEDREKGMLINWREYGPLLVKTNSKIPNPRGGGIHRSVLLVFSPKN
jgi:hypothetical protein